MCEFDTRHMLIARLVGAEEAQSSIDAQPEARSRLEGITANVTHSGVVASQTCAKCVCTLHSWRGFLGFSITYAILGSV